MANQHAAKQASGQRIATRATATSRKVVHIIFINGLASDNLAAHEAPIAAAPAAGKAYWNAGFVAAACEYFNVPSGAVTFTDEPFGAIHASSRDEVPYISAFYRAQMGSSFYANQWQGKNFGVGDPAEQAVALITHSMGAAYSLGIMDRLIASGIPVSVMLHINPFQPASPAFPSWLSSRPAYLHQVHVQTRNDPVVRYLPKAFEDWAGLAHLAFAGFIKIWRKIQQPGWIPGASHIMREGPADLLLAHYHPIGQGRAFWFPHGARAAFGHPYYDQSW